MCNKCTFEEECVCLKEAMENLDNPEGLVFIRDFLNRKRQSRNGL